jgi:hypothetical protein
MGSIMHPNSTDNTIDTKAEKEKREAIACALRSLLEGDEKEQCETFEYLKKSIDEDRSSERKLFQ